MVPGNLGTLCSDAALLAKQQDSLEGFSSCVLSTGTSLDIQREVAVEHLFGQLGETVISGVSV